MLRIVRIGIAAGSLGLTVSGLTALAMGGLHLWKIIEKMASGEGSFEEELALIGTVDLFLLGIGILVIAIGIVNLTIRNLSLPKGLQFTDLHQLKSTFASFLILIMAILYLESLASLRSLERTTASNPITLLYGGLGFLAVTIGLMIFERGGSHDSHASDGADTTSRDSGSGHSLTKP